MAEPSDGGSHDEQAGDISKWSWLVAAVGLVLIVGSAGFMLYRAFAGDSSPPDLVIETDSVVSTGAGYLVPIRVRNRGGSAAAGLIVEGVLKQRTTTVEASMVAMTYVPAGSQRRAGLIFSRDPQKFDLQVRAKGYEQP
jgi:uncharacterized protein (TIGR02588 family)